MGTAPPPLPVYEQPYCPSPGYIWTPGYWAYGPYGYFWVPGTWVLAPEVGYLWTPGYWGWGGDDYMWHPGYWGPQVGFYGGIDYGYGYYGNGYQGGYWRGRDFYYNRAVNRVNVTNIHNTYNTTVVNNTVNRVSYNGGNGGISARPNAGQEAALRERHIPATQVQTQHEHLARGDRAQWATVNHGRPEVAATPKPTNFHGAGVVRAKNAPVTNNPAVEAPRPNNANRANGAQPSNNRSVPQPPTRENEPRSNNAGTPRPNNPTATEATPRNSNAPQAPLQESSPRSNNAPAPRPENPNVAHPSPPQTSREVSQPPAHQNRPAPYVSQPPAQREAAPHQSAPSRPPSESREPHGSSEPPR